MRTLPNEVWVLIFEQLNDPKDLGRLLCVCTTFRALGSLKLLWRRLFDKIWSLRYSLTMAELRGRDQVDTLHWKRRFIMRAMVESNWNQGFYETRLLRGHTKVVGTLFMPADDVVISGSHDGTFKLWDLNGAEPILCCAAEHPIEAMDWTKDWSQPPIGVIGTSHGYIELWRAVQSNANSGTCIFHDTRCSCLFWQASPIRFREPCRCAHMRIGAYVYSWIQRNTCAQ